MFLLTMRFCRHDIAEMLTTKERVFKVCFEKDCFKNKGVWRCNLEIQKNRRHAYGRRLSKFDLSDRIITLDWHCCYHAI